MSVSVERLPDVLIGLSDLFFNYEHPNYDALHRETSHPTVEDEHAALVKDAEDFLGTFAIAINGVLQVNNFDAIVFEAPSFAPAQLAQAFLERL